VDNCGNTTTGTQVVTVRDTTEPVLSGVPGDSTVECSEVPTPASPTATDNCDTDVQIIFSEIRADGPCPDTYTLTRTWTAVDNCGNATPGTQVLSVQDTTAPVLTCGLEPVYDDEDEEQDEQIDGLYRVRYSGTDNCDAAPELLGYIDVYGNDETCDDETPDFLGYPVGDGDIVRLNCSADKPGCTRTDEVSDETSDEGPEIAVEITGPAMKLTVTGRDACGNRSQTECFVHCPNPEGCIHAITLKNKQGEEKTFYWYEFGKHMTVFEVGGESGSFETDCSKCLRVGDVSGDLAITCTYGGGKLAKKCKLPEDYFSTPCP
jgi:hypothetical protein